MITKNPKELRFYRACIAPFGGIGTGLLVSGAFTSQFVTVVLGGTALFASFAAGLLVIWELEHIFRVDKMVHQLIDEGKVTLDEHGRLKLIDEEH